MHGYFVITGGEDGIRIDGPITKDEMLKRINEGYYGENEFTDFVPSIDKGCFMGDPRILIIEGRIVVPRAKKTVVQFDL